MYPTITDLLRDLFGISIPLPIQTFGFFVGLGFLTAIYFSIKELQRKEEDGLLKPTKTYEKTGYPPTTTELITNALAGFLLGYKLLYIILDYQNFTLNPQDYILSTEGNLIGGLVAAAALSWMKYSEKKKNQLEKPYEKEVIMRPFEHMGNITLLAGAGGFIGAKIFHNLENWNEFMADPVEALLSFSGLTMYGGLIVAATMIYFYCRKHGLRYITIADSIAPGLMLSYGVGRIGCHMSGDGDWGIVNSAPMPQWLSFLPEWMWSYNYPNNVINDGVPIPGCVGRHCYQLPEGVYPTSFYEFLMTIVLFAILWSIRKRFNAPGLLFSIYLMMNGAERLLIESIRVNTRYEIGSFSFTQAQLIAVLMMMAGAVLFRIYHQKNKTGELTN
jgi:phosphatidylglycerol---prolipoprotein diacylglyceryl transferase